MKNMKNLLGLLLMAAIIGFTSCSEDDDDDAIGPSISFFGGDFIDADYTATSGETLQFSWLATQGDAKLESFSVTRDGVTLQDYVEPDIPKDNYQDTLSTDAPLNEGSYKYEFTVTDKDGVSDSKNFTITVEASSVVLTSHSAKLLYAPTADGTSETVIDLETGTTYSINNGGSSSASIDLGYYYLNADGATLVAPSEYPQAVIDDISGWSTKNATELKTTTESFSSITTDVEVETAWSSAGTSTNIQKSLSVGDVLLFKTVNDKYGAIKISEISGTFNQGDYIKIDIKVE